MLSIAGELLSNAEGLLRDGLHTAEVADGYVQAAAKVRPFPDNGQAVQSQAHTLLRVSVARAAMVVGTTRRAVLLQLHCGPWSSLNTILLLALPGTALLNHTFRTSMISSERVLNANVSQWI